MNRTFNESYLVRILHDGGTWRAKITHISSGQHRFFTTLDQLWLFWQEETAVLPATKELKVKENYNDKS